MCYAAMMAKAQRRYVCQSCGSVSHRWQGQCADCNEWNTLVEEAAAVVTPFQAKHNLQSGGRALTLVKLDAEIALPERMTFGIAELDRALGGGLVAGSATLIGGDPGVGKSTLLLQAAALSAARTVVGDGRIIALHQPHTYSRTQEMFREFADVLETHADHTVVLDVYGAREDPVPGVTGELVSGAFADPERVHFVADWQKAADYTAGVAREGDFIVTLGCGNVNLIVPQVLEALARTED